MAKKYNEIEAKDNMKIEDKVDDVAGTEKEKVKKIVSAEPKKVKRGLLSRLATGVLGPEGVQGIGQYVGDEIIKPAIKNIIVDAVTSGINMVMYGEKGGPRSGQGYRPTNYQSPSQYRPNTNYTSRYTSQQAQPVEPRPRNTRYGVQEFLIGDRHDATNVLASLIEYADNYNAVSVADYYDMIGVHSEFTDNSYGWTMDSITRASVVPVRGGFVIKFPPVEVI